MENLDLMGFLIITLNCNVTIVGKIWLIFTLLVRMLAVVLAGYPIYRDEQERFVCNTLQPGCANVCYDAFSPVSPLRFWLAQSVSVLLPCAIFSAYVLHRGAQLAASDAGAGARRPSDLPGGDGRWPAPRGAGRLRSVPDFSAAYLAHVSLRTLLEAASGALHYLLFGFWVPERFSCARPPCSSAVDCYVSRPTEKGVLMLFFWAVSALSFLLGVADLACGLRRSGGAGCGPRARGSSPGRAGLPEDGRSRAASSAGDQTATADTQPRGGPLGSRAHLAGHDCAPRLQPPGRPASEGSAPHLRAQKSEWV
ncbi:gap junction delta-4 protein [Dipodomys spectabilis]|uniref:gap junction delta-4 protein n=1 Tax=Dipodomys spectabilis TaxID=105255 RepID=UPI001C53E289|nr:gap junction delta-4 protein [Dipodomys spectabilis]